MAEKLASLRKKGGKGVDWFKDNMYFDGTTLRSFTNGSTITLNPARPVVFNCKKYSQCYNSSTIGVNIYGINADTFTYLGGAGTTNVSDYDYMLVARGGSTNSMPFYFS